MSCLFRHSTHGWLHDTNQIPTVDSSEVGFIVSASFIGKVLCDVHVSLNFLLYLLQTGPKVHLPVVLIQTLKQLLKLGSAAVVPDLFLLMFTVLFTGKEATTRR